MLSWGANEAMIGEGGGERVYLRAADVAGTDGWQSRAGTRPIRAADRPPAESPAEAQPLRRRQQDPSQNITVRGGSRRPAAPLAWLESMRAATASTWSFMAARWQAVRPRWSR